MILTCPSCSAKYMISHDSIGEKGRDVRCAKCGHQWFQKSEKDALDDLIARIQSEEIDEIAFSEGKYGTPKPAPAEDSGKDNLLLQKLGAIFRTLEKRFPIFSLLSSRAFAGGISALAVFMVLLNIAIQFRIEICTTIPVLEKVYEAAGYHVDIPNGLTTAKTFAVERLAVNLPESKTDKSVILTGTLINLTDQSVYIPAIGIRFLGREGQEVGEQQFAMLSQSILDMEASIPMSIRLEDGLPEGTAAVDIVFVTDAEAKKHIKEYPSPDQVHTAYEEDE